MGKRKTGRRRKKRTSRKSSQQSLDAAQPSRQPPKQEGPTPARTSRRRIWLFRLAALFLVPGLFFLTVELGLRIFGYGRSTDFFLKIEGRDAYTTNREFGWRFFPPAIARCPDVCEIPIDKPDDTYRIFVLGGSAAMGTPEPALGFARMLEVMLRERFPDNRFEVVNAAMTAINSHVVLPIARECVDHDADLMIVYMGNNEVVGPYGAATVFGDFSPNLSIIRASIYLKSTRIGQLLNNLLSREAGSTEWKGMRMFLDNRIAADDARMETIYRHFRSNLDDICCLARDSATPLIACTVATNIRDNAPFAAVHRDGLTEKESSQWDKAYRLGIELADNGKSDEAHDAFLKAAEIDDRHAELHFRLARVLLALQQFGEARNHFVEARDLDALRFRADSRINEIIRDVAGRETPGGVYLVDAERAFEATDAAEHGIPGRESFYEHVHMTPEGNYLLAKTIFEQIVAILPEAIRTDAGAKVSAPSQQRCFELLPLTQWDRYRMKASVTRMISKAPFTNQIGHDERIEQAREELLQLRIESLDSAALDKAHRAYTEAMERTPDNLILQRTFARLSEQRGDYGGAAEQWRMLLSKFPDMASWHTALGGVLEQDGKPDEAIAEFRVAMRLMPHHAATGHCTLGDVLLRHDKADAAADQFRKALRIDPKRAHAYAGLAMAFQKQGKQIEAIEHFRKAIEHDEDYAAAHNNLAVILAKQGQWTEAVEHYRRTIRLDPEDVISYHNLAMALAKQGETEEAFQWHRRAVRLAPDNADTHYWLANALVLQREIAEAADAYRVAVEIAPDHLRARNNLANALIQLDQTAEAAELYQQILRRHPDFVPALFGLADILATDADPRLRDGTEAVRLAQKACEQEVQPDPALLNTLAAAYAETGRFADAIETARQALRQAQSKGDQRLARSIRRRLSLYEQDIPYHRQ